MARSPEQIQHDLLVLQAQSGDREAMADLVDRWQTCLWRIALAKLGDQEAAWDVVQDAWLAILRSLRKLRQPEAFGRWAMQIVANIASGRIRRGQRHAKAIRSLTGPLSQGSPGSACIDSQRFSDLPEAQAQALALFYWERMSVSEIAEMLDLPSGTVKSRLYHARKNLKRLIGENE